MARKRKTETLEHLTNSLDNNIHVIKNVLLDDDLLIVRHFENKINKQKYAILFIDGMVSNELINENIIKPLLMNTEDIGCHQLSILKEQVILANKVEILPLKDKMIDGIIRGDTLLFVDGFKEALIISTNDVKTRQIEEPTSEKVIRGPREGFTESLTMNLSLIRKRIQHSDLKFKTKVYEHMTKTKICICYIKGITNEKILKELEKRLDSMNLNTILDSNYIQEVIKDAPYSPFKTIGTTERPDVVAAKLLEGRIAIIVDGTPVALTLPFLFIENLQSNEDYYINFYFSTIGRLIRTLGFFLTISTPALYLSLISYHQEVIPTQLFLSIYAARQAIPFPTAIELLTLLIVFEILREAGTRMPSHIGQALSIVGALVLGQAAVEARFVSAPMVIVVGFTGITSLMTPKLTGAAITTRTILILLTALMGLYGYFFGIAALLVHLFNIRSFGVFYMDKLTSIKPEDVKDTVIRAPWGYMQKNQKRYLDDKK